MCDGTEQQEDLRRSAQSHDEDGEAMHDGTGQQEDPGRSAQSDDKYDTVASCCTTPHETHDGAKPLELHFKAQLRSEEDEQEA